MNINNLDEIRNNTTNSTYELASKLVDENYKYIESNYEYDKTNEQIICSFIIPSFNFYKEYKTKIVFNLSGKIKKHSCNCKAYSFQGICEHVISSIIIINKEKNDIFSSLKIENNITNPLIESFKNNSKQRKRLPLSIELIKESIRTEKGYYEVKINIDSYVLKKNINEFFEIYYLNEGSTTFGKNFEYTPKLHYFSEKDSNILNVLPLVLTQKTSFSKDIYSIDSSYLSTYSYKSKMLFDTLRKNKKEFVLTIDGIRYKINEIKDDFAPIIDIIKDKDISVSIDLDDALALTDDYSYIFLNDNIYYLDNEKAVIIKEIKENGKIQFCEQEEKEFSKYVMPKLRTLSDKIDISKNLSEKYNLSKPDVKLYFDTCPDGILCNIKCKYNDIEIDILDSNETYNDIVVVRDKKVEESAKDYVCDLGFYEDEVYKAYVLSDEDLVIDFIDYRLQTLNKYDIFVTDKLKEVKYIKKPIINSSFSLERGELLKCNISIDGLDNDEIDDLMESLKYKKKFFKLKNGSYLNIEDSKELYELDNMLNMLNVDYKQLNNNEVIIPKYKSLYINSKLNNNSFITVDDAFKKFIDNYYQQVNKEIIIPKPKNVILRDYQETGIRWLITLSNTNFGGILADEMGLGKTLQTIMYISSRLKEDRNREILVVCPTSLIYNWESEFKKYAPDIKVKVISDIRKKREKIFDELKEYEVFITSYGLLREDIEKYKTVKYDTMIIDEAQTIKNVNAQITHAVKEINADNRLALTGTPIENSILELYSIFDFIMPGFFGTVRNFQSKYSDILKEENTKIKDDFLKLINPFILRRKKKDVIKELPDKIEDNIVVDLSTDEKKIYLSELRKITSDIKNNMRNNNFNKNKLMILQELTRLRQICISPSLCIENYNEESSKINSLVDVIESAILEEHKILVFSSFTSALSIVKKKLLSKKIKYYYLDGSTKAQDRISMVNNFNNNEIPVFLISLKAGGNGLNLIGADIVIHLDPWWNPAVEDQATDRAHRIGQKKVVQVIKMIAKGTIEEKILKLQLLKKNLSNQIVEGDSRDKNILSTLTSDDLLYLLENE